jgi:ribonuclease-3
MHTFSFGNFNEQNKAITREDITRITGYNPINVLIYQNAFIHKSVLRFLGDTELKNSYERYEFLGDSVLNLIIADFIFRKYPNEEEGFLTKIKTKLVNGKTLAFFTKKLKLDQYLVISQNVEKINGRKNDRILEDIFEAFLCSIHLDLGYKYVEHFVLCNVLKFIDFDQIHEDNNYKDILLRKCQKMLQINPEYELVSTTGPGHNKTFTSVVVINGARYCTGIGCTKKESEQLASKNTLLVF